MAGESPNEQREHEVTLQVFSISAAMVGVCLTAIGILRLVATQTQVESIGDELLAADAVLFVICCFISFWSFKTRPQGFRQRLRLLVDALFLVALVLMVVVCAIIAYALV